MSYLNDIEDFTTDCLWSEILRREAAAADGRCWYCSSPVDSHTCKLASRPAGTTSPASSVFPGAWRAVAKGIHATAVEKGWWDAPRNDGEVIALIHSELSEALEAIRHGNPPDDKIPEHSGAAAELADVVIRVMDYGHARGWDIAGAMVAKTAFNKTREFRHGGKAF